MLGSANKLKTPRTISLSGDVTGSTSFDGSGNVTIPTSVKNPTTQTAVVNTTKNDTAFKFIIKRNMNVVHINVELTMALGKSTGSGIINMDKLLPDWAKCSGNTSEFLGVGTYLDGVSPASGSSYSHIECFCRCDLSYSTTSSIKHRTTFSYTRIGTEEKTINFAFSYII